MARMFIRRNRAGIRLAGELARRCGIPDEEQLIDGPGRRPAQRGGARLPHGGLRGRGLFPLRQLADPERRGRGNPSAHLQTMGLRAGLLRLFVGPARTVHAWLGPRRIRLVHDIASLGVVMFMTLHRF